MIASKESASVATQSLPIRVLHLGSPTGLYGAERWILALVRHLPPSRVASFVAVIKDAPELQAPLCAHASRYGLRTLVVESFGKFSFSAIPKLRRFILDNEIEVLHTHGYKSDILGCLAACGTQCKRLTTPHGWSLNAGVKLQLYEALDRLCFYLMDCVAPLSGDLHVGLARMPGMRQKLHLIENGMDLSELDIPTEPPHLLQQWRAEGDIVIGYVGQLIRRKRIDTLIQAFQQIDVAPKRLCIIGDGPQRAELEQLAAAVGGRERITFLGYRDDRIALLKGLDLFVLPSELEGIPRCLMEAMAVGVPVITSDIPGCRDLVEQEVTGLLFRSGDASELARQMIRLIKDERLRGKIANQGRQLMRETRSAATMAQSYLELYEKLLGNVVVPKTQGIK
jgi:glycosyltransferase involved in cell wall biosynthesis